MTDAAGFLMLALQAVSSRVILVLALLISSGLYAWAMWRGDLQGLYVAIAFSVLVFLPVLKVSSHGKNGQASE